jgi:hypothetical protein
MLVTSSTLWRDFESIAEIVSEGTKERITLAAMRERLGVKSWYDMTVGVYLDYVSGDKEAAGIKDDATVYEHYYAEALQAFAEQFAKTLATLTLQREGDEIAASEGCVPMSDVEGALVFLRKYFGLPSFNAVRNLTLNEWLIAKHDDYNNALFRRNYNKIQQRKSKQKK